MRRLISLMAVIIWMSTIFYLSHQPASKSSELSTGITEVIINTIEKVVPQVKIEKASFHHIIRKNAHFFYYLILGILTIVALKISGVGGYRKILLALMVCILFAISDEVHQIFIPGRSGEIRDVIIDSAGSSAGILGYLGVSWVIGIKNKELFIYKK